MRKDVLICPEGHVMEAHLPDNLLMYEELKRSGKLTCRHDNCGEDMRRIGDGVVIMNLHGLAHLKAQRLDELHA